MKTPKQNPNQDRWLKLLQLCSEKDHESIIFVNNNYDSTDLGPLGDLYKGLETDSHGVVSNPTLYSLYDSIMNFIQSGNYLAALNKMEDMLEYQKEVLADEEDSKNLDYRCDEDYDYYNLL